MWMARYCPNKKLVSSTNKRGEDFERVFGGLRMGYDLWCDKVRVVHRDSL